MASPFCRVEKLDFTKAMAAAAAAIVNCSRGTFSWWNSIQVFSGWCCVRIEKVGGRLNFQERNCGKEEYECLRGGQLLMVLLGEFS
jgi:hypothetical protein